MVTGCGGIDVQYGSKKFITIIFLVALAAFLVACEPSSSATTVPQTATPDARPTETLVPTPTATPVPTVTTISADPITETQAYIDTLPADQVACAILAIGQENLEHLVRGEIALADLTKAETDVMVSCFNTLAVRSMIISEIESATGGLTPRSRDCVEDATFIVDGNLVFSADPDADQIIALYRALFCLTEQERETIGDSGSRFGLSEFGGIGAVECVVSGVRPTQFEQLFKLLSPNDPDINELGEFIELFVDCGVMPDAEFRELGGKDAVSCVLDAVPTAEHGRMLTLLNSGQSDFSELSEYLPVFIRCGTIDESMFDDIGLSSAQILCLVDEIGIEGIEIIAGDDSNVSQAKILSFLPAFGTCGIDIEALMDEDSDSSSDPRFNHGLDPSDLPFSPEQNRCLLAELDDAGEDVWRNLGSGDEPTIELLAALAACRIDASDLAGPVGDQRGDPTPTPTTLITVELSFNQILTAVLTQTENDCLHTNMTAASWQAFEQMIAGDPVSDTSASAEIATALAICGIDLSSLAIDAAARREAFREDVADVLGLSPDDIIIRSITGG